MHHFVSEPFLIGRGLSNYWGYNTLGFFAPHCRVRLGRHARPAGPRVQGDGLAPCTTPGIEVILDVVYNHTGEGGHEGPTLSFRGLDHLGYYRLTDDQRNDYDVTGCGNSVDTSEPGVLRLVARLAALLGDRDGRRRLPLRPGHHPAPRRAAPRRPGPPVQAAHRATTRCSAGSS